MTMHKELASLAQKPAYDTVLKAMRLPSEVKKAILHKVADKRKKFPRYDEQDVVLTATVKELQSEGYLEKERDYL